ncbi:methyltransferase domain-containing protein [Tropicibacter naphthalenivorans]|uniref:Methyltransferase domain protein n=1 Tax=Tropicibacter naphthalenivorans TaxID=441103 RepID=A0A0P1G073_9RHOB|nr:methyltransferase domain-containing protein [Tropicibacter naphthalenivorans]CUH75043.1 Methyltransferase domain protein [Tropicibacter naphthalenivorans]SMC47170.1 Methyltransferase domain-containing protein [Tropicibacter naphthalenivorans]
MHLDVKDLRDFYYRSALGRAAQKIIRAQMLAFWPEAQGLTVAGYGFAVPLLRPYLPDARRVIGMMPAPQGVMPWPASMPNVSVLCEEALWPLETGHVDRLVLMHGLETTERPSDVLDEAYRVLGPGGQVMFILPNRSGLWARSDRTPFGFGRPYSLSQLEDQLKRHDFVVEDYVSVLYQPPSSRRFWMKTGPIWERIGRAIPAVAAGGVMMVLASKRHPPQRRGLGEAARVLNPLDVLAPKPGKVAGANLTREA